MPWLVVLTLMQGEQLIIIKEERPYNSLSSVRVGGDVFRRVPVHHLQHLHGGHQALHRGDVAAHARHRHLLAPRGKILPMFLSTIYYRVIMWVLSEIMSLICHDEQISNVND